MRALLYLAAVLLLAAGLVMFGMQPGNTSDLNESTTANSLADKNVETGEAMDNKNWEKATFAAGCFWGVEASFRQIEGVKATSVGYTGGHTEDPTYREVCGHGTGHAEAVEVIYDPTKVKYEDLLKVFWENHDPTQLNRQGPDVGDQYRSAIYFHTPEQEAAARKSKEQLEASGVYKRPVVTEITAATMYYLAEDYHQQYLEKRGLSTCKIK